MGSASSKLKSKRDAVMRTFGRTDTLAVIVEQRAQHPYRVAVLVRRAVVVDGCQLVVLLCSVPARYDWRCCVFVLHVGKGTHV